MAYYLAPIAAVMFFIGLFAMDHTQVQYTAVSSTQLTAKNEGQIFVEYRDAVATYQQNNPTFIGTVPTSALIAQGNQFPSSFLGVTSNSITQVGGGSGRVITCYSALPPGAIAQAIRFTNNDASLGIASGTNWTSAAYGVSTTPVPLSTTVPNGNAVSVIQIGS